MKFQSVFAVALFATTASLAGCGGSDTTTPAGPVIDSLDVPAQATTMTLNGQSGPGVTLTITAHDDNSGLTAIHIVFTEAGGSAQDVQIPGAPTKLTDEKVQLVLVGAPKGDHPIAFSVTDAAGRHSATIDKTITVP